MIRAESICMRYPGGIDALSEVSFSIEPGEFVFLMGPSGAGKTTLLRALSGLQVPDAGHLFVDGLEVTTATERRRRALRRHIGLVSQDFQLVGDRTVAENVEMALRVLGISGQDMKKRVNEALAAVGLADRHRQRLASLSWGEQQRIALARALVRRPRLVLADEPTGNLDEKNAQIVFALLKTARERGAAVVVATHAAGLVEQQTERLLYLERGQLVKDIPSPHCLIDRGDCPHA